MAESHRSKARIVFPAIALALATSFYYSWSFTIGIIAGYVLCRIFCTFFVHNGKVKSIFIDYGEWKFHLHHWIIGIAVLTLVWIVDYFYLPTFFAGAICGIIIQDIYDYNDWHQVIIKNNAQDKVLA